MAPPSKQSPSPQSPPKKGGFSIRRVLLILLLLAVIGGVAIGFRMSARMAREKSAAEMATLIQDLVNATAQVKSAIQASPEIKEKLGEALTFETPTPGEMPPGADLTKRDNVPFVMNVKGDKALGMARGAIARSGADWKVLSAEVVTADGGKIPVTVSADAPPELQFDLGDGK